MADVNEAARLLGRKGGKRRAQNLSAEELSRIGKLGVKARMKLTPEERSEAAKKAWRTRRSGKK